MTLSRAVLAARAGKWEDAQALLGGAELRMLAGPNRGLADVLRAWAATQLSGERRPVDLVSMLGESSADRLGPVWPELHEFLVRAAAA